MIFQALTKGFYEKQYITSALSPRVFTDKSLQHVHIFFAAQLSKCFCKHCITSLTQHVKVWSEDRSTVFNETVLPLIYLQLPSFILHIIHLHLIILLHGNNSCNLSFFFFLLPTADLCISAAINKPSDHMRKKEFMQIAALQIVSCVLRWILGFGLFFWTWGVQRSSQNSWPL